MQGAMSCATCPHCSAAAAAAAEEEAAAAATTTTSAAAVRVADDDDDLLMVRWRPIDRCCCNVARWRTSSRVVACAWGYM
jgi:hypothetical protein